MGSNDGPRAFGGIVSEVILSPANVIEVFSDCVGKEIEVPSGRGEIKSAGVTGVRPFTLINVRSVSHGISRCPALPARKCASSTALQV